MVAPGWSGADQEPDDEQVPTLSETGAAVLRAAADHPDHVASPPEHLPAARNTVMASLLRAGLLEAVAPAGEGKPPALWITPAGLAAIGREAAVVAVGEAPFPGPGCADGVVSARPARLPLRQPVGAVLAAWDAGEDRPALPGAVEALRAALARRGGGSRLARDSAAPRRPREGTKHATALDLLRRSEGATIADVIGATDWQQHTVRQGRTGGRREFAVFENPGPLRRQLTSPSFAGAG